MDDEEDLHVCLRCRDTIIGLTNYVAHRRAGCSAAREGQKEERLAEGSGAKSRAEIQANEAEREVSASETSGEFTVQPRPGEEPPNMTQEAFSDNVRSHSSGPRDETASATVDLNYVSGTSQAVGGPQRDRQEVSHIQDSYAVMEDYANALPRSHSEPEIRSDHSHLKAKPHDSMSLSRRQTPSQAPFTGYSDPLLPHGQESSNMTLFRHFDSFSDHAKIQHEGETESHSVPMSLFKVPSSSYDLESQNFESRYSDFYGLQPNPQEPLLSTVSAMEHCKAKREEAAEVTGAANDHVTQNLKEQTAHADENTNVETRERGKWRPGSRPPPSVGGKWRPATPRSELEEDEIEVDDAEDDDFSQMPPPPTYTKGKWLPGKKLTNIIKVGSSIEYHCHACNRTLKGKETYERHLNSELHFVNENKASALKGTKILADVTPSSAPSRPVRSKKLEAQSFLKSTIARLKSRKILSPHSRSTPTSHKASRAETQTLSENKAVHVKQEVKVEPQVDEDEEEMKTTACIKPNFYCNLHEDFVIHMKTHKNDPEDDEVKTLYTCSVCNDEDSLLLPNAIRHLQTPHHLSNARDVVLQAHQVIMSSRSAVVCPLGDGTFRYFREYRRHRRLQHQDPGFQLSDQRLLRCPQCNFRALRERQIRAHIKEAHELTRKSDAYHCFVCGLAFVTHRQAELHRRSAEHRTTLGRQRGLSVLRTCTLCYVEVEDLPALRRHMCQEHRKDCTPCHLCGLVPPLRSDLAQHQRNCSGSPGDWAGMHKCELCSFKNDLLAHVLTHTTLAHGQRGADNRYSCHICKTKLRFSSVKGHMLSHSNEWPHACHLCSRKFPRQKWLDRHLSVVHTRGEAQLSDGPALCDTCGKTFSNRWHLQRHQQEAHSHAALTPPSQSEKAPSDAAGEGAVTPSASRAKRAAPPVPTPTLCDVCGVQCDSASMLKAHRQGHKRREGDVYQCPHCNYSTGHLPHLRRHLRLHTGSTPFSCPYCAYSCNNQENLRKHMLKTKRHPGRFMYECRLCASLFGAEAAALKPMSHEAEDAEGPRRPMDYGDAHVLGPLEDSRAFASPGPLAPLEGKLFKTNYATEFHAHLLERHRNHFDTKEEIQQLSEGAPGEAEDDGARQVILILPDKFSEQTGDVAALLPSLGLAPSPSDCVSIVTVQPKDAAEGGHAPPSQLGVLSSDHSLPGTSHAKDGPEGCPNDAVLMPADQVVTLETQMVPDATIIEGGVAPEGAAQVVLCPPAADPEQVLNPLHMVAEAAEALTQSDMLAAQVMEAPHTAPPPVRHQAQMLPAALFEPGGSIQQPGAGQLPGAARMLQQEPTLEFVDNRVVAAEVGAKGGASDTQAEEIIYSFTLP
ncbi:putative zinc finger protein 62 [Penaeus vannamei]|uniref:Putative zinc finger protein 62 n=1 Tax=Penaeus vannamei TaxID=6689 RepID=A0A423TGW9_PENVA|nr:putative zinc finger protein 62 [Penaeus vannamei]